MFSDFPYSAVKKENNSDVFYLLSVPMYEML